MRTKELGTTISGVGALIMTLVFLPLILSILLYPSGGPVRMLAWFEVLGMLLFVVGYLVYERGSRA